MEIVVDFDGTCVAHAFPKVGVDIGAVPVLMELVKRGHKLILFTMRSNVKGVGSPEFPGTFTGDYLDDAVKWFRDRNIPLYGIQINPSQRAWTTSPKAYGQMYIDDCALGTPVLYNPDISERPFVDWEKVYVLLHERGIL